MEKYQAAVKNNKLQIIAPTWNDEFELSDRFSDIQYYIEYAIKNHKTLANNPPIRIYITRIKNRLLFKIKDGYKLEFRTPETMMLFGSPKKLVDKTKNGENVPSLEVVEVLLRPWSFIENQCQQQPEVLHTFVLKKSHSFLIIFLYPINLLSIEQNNLVF